MHVHLCLRNNIQKRQENAGNDVNRVTALQLFLNAHQFNMLFSKKENSHSKHEGCNKELPEKFIVNEFREKLCGVLHRPKINVLNSIACSSFHIQIP